MLEGAAIAGEASSFHLWEQLKKSLQSRWERTRLASFRRVRAKWNFIPRTQEDYCERDVIAYRQMSSSQQDDYERHRYFQNEVIETRERYQRFTSQWYEKRQQLLDTFPFENRDIRFHLSSVADLSPEKLAAYWKLKYEVEFASRMMTIWGQHLRDEEDKIENSPCPF